MASKQLGRLRQWAGEVISSREKTTVHEEFLDLEKDIELRRDGVHRLLVASEGYYHILSKKKASDSLMETTEKLLPIDTLGLVMISHGEEFGQDSSFGRALVKLGRAHCKVATLQEAYALTLKDTFMASMDQFKDDIKEYEALRKKLDSKKLTYDAAATKYEKVLNSKKEKDKREAEDELERTKQQYDEMSEDLRAHMHAIQENEYNQLEELTSFLSLETNFVQSYLAVLHDVKEGWHGGSIKKNDLPKSKHPSIHIPQLSRANSLHSNGRGAASSCPSSEISDSEPVSKHSRRGSSGSKPSSRPASRLSRMRVNSGASGEEEKGGTKKSRRMSVASWVDSVTGSKDKKSKDTEAFATLDDDAAVNNTTDYYQTDGTGGTPKKSTPVRSSSKSKSKENMSPSRVVAPRILKPPSMQGKKVVRALYDFTGSTDELSFKSGNEITVLNEVLDDWWMGELDGQRGLFPMSYTEGARPQNGKQDTFHKPGVSKGVNRYRKDYITNDVDEDGELASAPMMIESPTYGNFNDAMSIASSLVDDEDDFRTQPMFFPREVQQPFSDANHRFVVQHPTPPPPSPRPKRRVFPAQESESLIIGTMDDDPSSHDIAAALPSNRKLPPPPPPRRPANRLPASGPPVPRKPPPSAKTSPSESLLNVTSSPSPISSVNHGYDRSPFDSAIELGATAVCDQFRQNPFKPEGMCSNCMEFHD